MSALNDFHFIYPYWFLLLPLVFLLVWWLAKNSAGGQAWQHFIDERLRPFVISGKAQSDGRWLRYSVMLASLVTIIALAGPSWEKRELPAFQTQQGLVLGLDLSSSMLAADVTPNRLTRARFKLMDLLNIREEGQTGLVVFAGDAFAVAPLTDDRENIIEQVKNLSPGIMPVQGSLVYRGIDESVELLRQAGYAQGDILVIADGVADLSRTLRRAEAAKAAGYRVSVASIGTEKSVPIPLSQNDVYRDQQGQPILVKQDKAALQKIAKSGGGLFLPLNLGDDDIERFQQFFQSDNSPLLQNNERSVEHWQNEGVWLLWLLLPLGLLLFRKGYLFSVLMACSVGATFIPQNSDAFEWDDLWLNSDQQAHKALLEDNAEQAKALFESPEWKASAAFRNGDFEESAGLFESQQTADAHYNRGTALAKAGKIEEAIKAYDEALALQGNHEDAKFNRDLLEKMKNQQDQQDQKGEKDQQQDQDQQDQDQQDQDPQGEKDQQDQKDQQEDKSQGDQNNDQDSQQQSEQEKQQAQQAAEEQRKKEAEEREKEAQEAKESQEQGDKPEGKSENKDLQSEEEKEQAKQTKQWLYQIPDDSAGLWRRKFQYQYRQRQPAPDNGALQPW